MLGGGGTGSKHDEQLWQVIMKQVDKNNDNMISYEEFKEVMTAMLT